MNPLDRSVIEKVIQDFARDPEIVKRLAWWLKGAHNCERWFQFEWAFRLDSHLQDLFPERYLVACEKHKRIDVVVYELPLPVAKKDILEDNSPAYAVELKWFRNWWVNEGELEKLKDDVIKINTYKIPALALATWLFVAPTEDNESFYCWISKLIRTGEGVANFSALENKGKKDTLNGMAFKYNFKIGPISCPHHPAFGELELWTVGFYNEAYSKIVGG